MRTFGGHAGLHMPACTTTSGIFFSPQITQSFSGSRLDLAHIFLESSPCTRLDWLDVLTEDKVSSDRSRSLLKSTLPALGVSAFLSFPVLSSSGHIGRTT